MTPGERFHITYASRRARRRHLVHGRGSRRGTSTTARSRPATRSSATAAAHVFHFHHYEQALLHEGTITIKAGPRAGETIRVVGLRNRDHSWGWRQDLTFRHHHWLCASFEDRFVEGTVMNETCYPDGDKYGGWISTDAGNDAVAHVDTRDAYWLAPDEPLPRPRPRRALPADDRGRRDRAR